MQDFRITTQDSAGLHDRVLSFNMPQLVSGEPAISYMVRSEWSMPMWMKTDAALQLAHLIEVGSADPAKSDLARLASEAVGESSMILAQLLREAVTEAHAWIAAAGDRERQLQVPVIDHDGNLQRRLDASAQVARTTAGKWT
ncbi:MAG: hypothetical protein GX446_02545 [Chthonomonadales bacterium]|nr:hypothetical protein [Chthonomonadales bacterium]